MKGEKIIVPKCTKKGRRGGGGRGEMGDEEREEGGGEGGERRGRRRRRQPGMKQDHFLKQSICLYLFGGLQELPTVECAVHSQKDFFAPHGFLSELREPSDKSLIRR